MLGLGFTEILLIAVVVLVFVGPDRLPEFMRVAGRIYGQVRRAGDELRTALTAESDRQEAEERYKKMLERRKQAEEARKKAAEIGAVPQDIPVKAAAVEVVGDQPHKQQPPASPQGMQLLPSEEDPETPMIRHRMDPMGVAPSPPTLVDAPPPGVTAAEWSSMPAHIREMLRKTA